MRPGVKRLALPPVGGVQLSLAGEHHAPQVDPVPKSLAEDGEIECGRDRDAAIEIALPIGGQERRLDFQPLERGGIASLPDLRIQGCRVRQRQGLFVPGGRSSP